MEAEALAAVVGPGLSSTPTRGAAGGVTAFAPLDPPSEGDRQAWVGGAATCGLI